MKKLLMPQVNWMRRLLKLLVLSLLLASCRQSPTSSETLKLLSPSGAPSLSTIPLFNQQDIEVEITTGSDFVQAAFVNPVKEYDFIIAPINLGVQLQQDQKTAYKLHSVISWGNLYLVGDPNAFELSSVTIAAFGQHAIVGKVFKQIVQQDSRFDNSTIEWYANVHQAQGMLLGNQAQMALLAMPVAQATITKAKELGQDLELLLDIQQRYQQYFGRDNFPQAALFVHTDSYDQHAEKMEYWIEEMKAFIKDPVNLEQRIEEIGLETLGLPSASLISATYDQLALDVVKAQPITKQLTQFFETLDIQLEEEYLIP